MGISPKIEIQDLHQFILSQFNCKIKVFQCDLGKEFNNHQFKSFAVKHDFVFRFSCPQMSQQNIWAEQMIYRLNNIIRTILTHAHLQPFFWDEALHTATYLYNILATKRLNFSTPHFALYLRYLAYVHLRVFGCACYTNTVATSPHKIGCIFLGYPPDHRVCRCFNQSNDRSYLPSRGLNESFFPFTDTPPPGSCSFLDAQQFHNPYPLPILHQTSPTNKSIPQNQSSNHHPIPPPPHNRTCPKPTYIVCCINTSKPTNYANILYQLHHSIHIHTSTY